MPLNLAARLVLSGTVTMPGSIMHQLLQHELGETPVDEAKERAWITDEQVRVHYQEPIVTDADGTERSWWPEKWSLAALQAMRHTRSYRKNMENRPLAGEGDYWTSEHFHYRQLDGYGRTVLYVDPATTTKASSDWTGLAVVSRAPARQRNTLHVRYATHVRLVGERLRKRVQAILAEHQDVAAIVVETNAGGDYLLEALGGLGLPVIPDPATESKEVRAERVLDLYERDPTVVYHAERFTILETEMEAFPTPGVHDDVLDATVGGLLFLLRRQRGRRQQQHSYA
jgi:phage terminase large subunit-like protein